MIKSNSIKNEKERDSLFVSRGIIIARTRVTTVRKGLWRNEGSVIPAEKNESQKPASTNY